MAIIRKKIWPEYFEDILSGKKKFELRLADFEVKEGDILILEEWDNTQKTLYRTENRSHRHLHPQNKRFGLLAKR